MSCCEHEKSFVSIEQHVCPVCGHTFETGGLLLHKQLKKKFDPVTVTNISLCPEHQKQLDEGYIFLVEIKDGSVPEGVKSLKQHEANRTGVYASIKKEAAECIFGEDAQLDTINFVDEQIIPQLQQMQEQSLSIDEMGKTE